MVGIVQQLVSIPPHIRARNAALIQTLLPRNCRKLANQRQRGMSLNGVLWLLVLLGVIFLFALAKFEDKPADEYSQQSPVAPSSPPTIQRTESEKVDALLKKLDAAAKQDSSMRSPVAEGSSAEPSAAEIRAQFSPTVALKDDCAIEDVFTENVARNRDAGQTRAQEVARFERAPIGRIPIDLARARADLADLNFAFNHPEMKPDAIGEAINEACIKRGQNPSDYAGKNSETYGI